MPWTVFFALRLVGGCFPGPLPCPSSLRFLLCPGLRCCLVGHCWSLALSPLALFSWVPLCGGVVVCAACFFPFGFVFFLGFFAAFGIFQLHGLFAMWQ